MEVDFLVIGQGLAGSALALALLEHDVTVFVVDSEDENSASRVAAGLVTTVAGKGMNTSWRQAEYLPEALAYYKKLELECDEVLFHPKKTLRLFDSEKQRLKFDQKKDALEGWVEMADIEDLEKWNGGSGGFVMQRGGWLDTRKYLEVVRGELIDNSRASYRSASFDENDLDVSAGKMNWKDITAKCVIFCQGARGLMESSLFPDIKHRSAKGEILTVSIPGADMDKIISRNGWLVPIDGVCDSGGLWRAGATYEWDDSSSETTDEGRVEIEKKIRGFTDLPYQVLEHSAGVRPIIRNSKPCVGRHSDFSQIYFFNGLGSKGVMTAPSVATHLAEHLCCGEELCESLVL